MEISAGDFGLSFLWPEIYCEGPLYEYEYEFEYEYWFTDSWNIEVQNQQ